ncbi:tyrosine-type recombinase/integrase [Radiobacillus kanasensis]|uniref:tyrosine-type recombinase/integrase n=1 Tax=Radiobacillus kanasensis TaxID=2844358 RepID=UPI002ED817F1
MTEQDIKKMITSFQNNGLKVSTINTRLRAYRAFFNFLYNNNHIEKNPIARIKLLKERKEVIETFTKEQLQKLFSACDLKTFVGVRDITIMKLFFDTGIRLNELVGIELQDLKKDKVVIKETKTYFQREVPITQKCKDQLEIYMKIRGTADTEKLFINQDGRELKRRSVQSRFEKYKELTGNTDVRVSPHTYRHTFAKYFVRGGGDAFHLQQILGHSSLEITKIYVNLFSEDVKESHRKYSPLNDL